MYHVTLVTTDQYNTRTIVGKAAFSLQAAFHTRVHVLDPVRNA